MDRRRLLQTLAAGSAGSVVAGCLGRPRPQRVTVTDGFEEGLAGWSTAAHIGPDAADPFDWRIEVTDERSAEGEQCLAVFTEGDHDDGTAWVVRPIPVERGVAYDVQGSVRAFAASESFNTVRQLVVALGPDAPAEEGDFPAPDTTSTPDSPIGGLREPLDRQAGWSEYAFEWATPGLDVDELFLAVGVTVVWETDRTDYLDDVRVSLRPRT